MDTRKLSGDEFRSTMSEDMKQLGVDAAPPFDFWEYVEHIPAGEYLGHETSRGSVHYVWEDECRCIQHVLLDTEDSNVFMVVVLDTRAGTVLGHRLLDLNREYGPGTAGDPGEV